MLSQPIAGGQFVEPAVADDAGMKARGSTHQPKMAQKATSSVMDGITTKETGTQITLSTAQAAVRVKRVCFDWRKYHLRPGRAAATKQASRPAALAGPTPKKKSARKNS